MADEGPVRAPPGAACPRCDYDLAGMVASWKDACPLSATCSECGLVFETTNVLSRRLLGPGWSFEHGPRVQASRWWRTSGWTLRPVRFCRQLRIDHRIRLPRLLVFVSWWYLVLHAVFALAACGQGARGGGGSWVYLNGIWQKGWDWSAMRWRALLPYGTPLGIPIRRGWTELPLFPVLLAVAIPTLLMPLWMTILGATFQEARVRRTHLVRGLVYSVPGAVLAVFVLCAGVVLVTVLALRGWSPPAPARGLILVGALLFFPAWHTQWWHGFVRDYLRLRHALATALLMQVMSVLVLAVTLTLIAAYGRPY